MRILIVIIVLTLALLGSVIFGGSTPIADQVTDEDKILRMAAKAYGCQYELLKAIRKAENGRKRFEFGIPDSLISSEVRSSYPEDLWQYYQAAKAVRKYQDRFISKHITLFCHYSVNRWVGAEHKHRHNDWTRNVVHYYKSYTRKEKKR